MRGVESERSDDRRGGRRFGWRFGRRRTGLLLLLVALVAGAVAHWAYWYRARAHAMAPHDSALLREPGALPVVLWVPFPHQNLGALGGAVERPADVLAAAARLAHLPPPRLPRLGPFGFPAGRELLLQASRDGEQVRAAVRFYPTTAILARLSGLLAGNPWLKGGTVQIRHRAARTWWDGLVWRLDAGSPPQTALPAPTPADTAPALAMIDLLAPSPPLPAGRYVLRAEGEDLVWRLGLPPASQPGPGALAPPWFFFWTRRLPEQSQALLLFEPERQGLLQNLPAAAAWASPSGALRLLPGGSFLHKLAKVNAQPFASGELAASERSAAQRADSLAPRWLPLAEGRSAPPLLLGGWIAIGPAARQAQQLHDILADIPFLGPDEARRWGDVATVLRAAHGYRSLSVWLSLDGTRGELHLAR